MPNQKIAKTCTPEDILRLVAFSGSAAYQTFRTIPIMGVRKACLETMSRFSWFRESMVDEVEQDLRTMAEKRDSLLEDYLSAYIRAIKDHQRAATFLETVPHLARRSRSRLMRRLMTWDEESYPIIREFLRSEVTAFREKVYKHPEKSWYDGEDWYCLTRALGILTPRGDYAILDTVRDIARRLDTEKVRPLFSWGDSDNGPFLLIQHRAYIHELLRQLEFAKAAATK
jgi:hypothetical protein